LAVVIESPLEATATQDEAFAQSMLVKGCPSVCDGQVWPPSPVLYIEPLGSVARQSDALGHEMSLNGSEAVLSVWTHRLPSVDL